MFFLALGQDSNLFGSMVNEGSNCGIKDPTESDIRRVIESIAKGEQDLAILIKDEDENMFIQTADGGRGRLLLEYQDGSPEHHYGALNYDITAQQVIDAFLEYVRGEVELEEPVYVGKDEFLSNLFTLIFREQFVH